MSTAAERRAYAIHAIRDIKENTVADAPQDDPGDICPLVFFERDGMFVAAGHAPEVNRDQGLELANIGIRGFAADSIIWCTDAHGANTPINPATGKEWGPGGMQNACDNEGACAVGVLHDIVMIIHYDRVLGVMSYQSIPYEVDKENHTVDWVDGPEWTKFDGADGVTGGYIIDELRRAFAAPILRHELIAQNALPLGLPARQQAGLDEITVAGLRLMGMKATLINKYAEEALREYASTQ
jgi:hypothetical protein